MHRILSGRLRLACLVGLLVCTVGCDQATKHIARTGLNSERPVTFPGGWAELRLAENPGSFLSLGALLPGSARFVVFTVGVGGGLVALGAYLTSRAPIGTTRFIGLSLVLAGGMGNLVDRVLRHGLVTDFAVINLGPVHTGVFNVADVLVMCGVTVMIWTFRPRSGPFGVQMEAQK